MKQDIIYAIIFVFFLYRACDRSRDYGYIEREHADSEIFIEPVDAIVNVLNCSYEEALHILENE